jgi:hypothetical protein
LRNHQHSSATTAFAAALATLASVGAGAVWADAPNYNIQTSGLIDGYYQYQFNNPKTGLITGRIYDFRSNTPTLSLAELNVFKNPKPGNFGFKATLGAGDTADINAAAVAGQPASATYEGRYKNFLQAYGTYSFGSNGSGIDFGKFYTPFGYEVTEANANFNYSHSLPYALLPFYHAGARIYSQNVDGFTGTVYIVRALYDTETAGVGSDVKSPSYVGSINYTDPKGKFVVVETLGGGKDKFNLVAGDTSTNVGGDGIENKALVSDTDFTYNLDASHIVGLNYTYASTKPDVKGAGSENVTGQGYAAYYKDQLNAKDAVALRYSTDSIKEDTVSQTARPWEATATYEIKATSNFTTRFEYRHDGSNVADTFVDSHGNTTKKDQDTVTVAGFFTF